MNTKITFVELVDMIAESTSTTKRVCELFVKELFATVSQALIDGEQVKIKGIGTFKVARMKPRKGVDVNTGEPIQIESHNKLTFTPDKSLAEAINQPFSQFETVVLDDDVTDEKLAAIDEEHPSAIPETPIAANGAVGTLADEFPEFHEPLPATEPDEFFVPEPIGSPMPVQEEKQEPEPTPEPMPEPEPEPQPMPAKKAEPEPVKAVEPEPVKVVESKPVKPVQEEPEPVDIFYRPEPRNAYTPTQEQINSASAKSKLKRWLWALLAAIVLGILGWLIFGGSDNGNKQNTESSQEVAPVDNDATTVEASSVITDTVTSKIVLSTLSDRYYDSPWFWVYIYEENKNIISDPNNVKPGTIVVIPPAEKYGIDANDPASLKKAQRLSWEILKGK